jgi:hypothetical protein
MIDLTKAIGAVAASVAALGGSYTLADKFGWFDRAILEWSPEHFKIVAEAGQPINVTVARIKKRDDCSVESFTPSIRDAAGMVHEATTTASKFSGPAGPEIDTFTYQLKMVQKDKIADAYRVLGLQPTAAFTEVKKAYKTLVKKWHPDLFVNQPQMQKQVQEKMRLVNEAYNILNDHHHQ